MPRQAIKTGEKEKTGKRENRKKEKTGKRRKQELICGQQAFAASSADSRQSISGKRDRNKAPDILANLQTVAPEGTKLAVGQRENEK